MREEYLLLAFASTHGALTAQKRLRDLEPVVMPTLREVQASCGISLRLRPGQETQARARLAEAAVGPWTLYRVVSEGGRPVCTPLP